MLYDYKCDSCGSVVEISKPHTETQREEICPKCQLTMARLYSSHLELHRTKVEDAEYNPAFGCVVKNRAHRDELARRHNLIEVGNESLSSLQKNIEKNKRHQEYDY